MTRALRALLIAVLVAGLAPSAAGAAVFEVGSTADQTDGNLGNGVCATAGGLCTLRAAVAEANALMGADTINVPAGSYETSSVLTVSSNLTINGAGARTTTVKAAGGIVLTISGSGEAAISGITITGGAIGMYVTGAELTLDRVAVRGNSSTTPGNISGVGMRIDPGSKVLIKRSAITGNTATSSSGTALGAGIHESSSQLDVRSTTIAGNAATGSSTARGGGISANGGTVSLRHVTLSGNSAVSGTADQYGGNLYVAGGATATSADSIFTGGVAGSGPNCAGTAPVASGRNIDSGTSCSFGAGQFSSTDPKLAPLADAGGQTDALVPDRLSPAVGQAAACPDEAIDQRGAAAPSGAGCDIGAVELSSNLSVTLLQSRATAISGTDVTFVATVANTGLDPAESTTLEVTSAGATEVPLVAPSAGTCTAAIRCELGTIAGGGRVTVAFVLRAGTAATLSVTALAASPTPQPSTADDAASGSLPVTAAEKSGQTGTAPVLGPLVLVGKARSGRTIRLSSKLSAATRLAVRIERLTPGRRSGKTCSAKAKRGTRCTITKLAGALTRNGKAGKLAITLPRLIGKRKLAPGRYRVTVQATDSAGRRSARRALTITVVR